MKRILDHDPYTGVTEIFHHDPNTEEWAIETVQDVSSSLEAAKDMRNDPDNTKNGIKSGMWHYAHLDDLVMYKMINEDGVNPLDPNNAKKVGELVESKYPYCKVTDGHHKFKG